jgi:ELWxxDGT repeat protein
MKRYIVPLLLIILIPLLYGCGDGGGGAVVIPWGTIYYFSADNGTNGRELWRSDGTPDGTYMVKDINPGSADSGCYGFTELGGVLYFSAADENNGRELWKTDGTEAGTSMVKDINPGSEDSDPQHLTVMNGVLYFNANDGTDGSELWRSDGTEPGTKMVKNLNMYEWPVGSGKTNGSSPNYLTVMNDTLYFQALYYPSGFNYQYELCRSDGTSDGTVLVKDINDYGENFGSSPSYITVMNDTLYFRAYRMYPDSPFIGEYELYKSNGTTGGTESVEIVAGTDGIYILYITKVGSTLYFSGEVEASGRELWKSDGTALGSQLVKDIYPGSENSSPSNFTIIDSILYFEADDGEHGSELWRSDGTESGTYMVKDINPGSSDTYPSSLEVMADILYFNADDGSNGRELWRSDGTETGTYMVVDLNSEGSAGCYNMATVGDSICFSADDGSNGNELWRSDGTPEGTFMVKDINEGPGNGFGGE